MTVYKTAENLHSRSCGMVLISRIYEKHKISNTRITSSTNKWLKWIKQILIKRRYTHYQWISEKNSNFSYQGYAGIEVKNQVIRGWECNSELRRACCSCKGPRFGFRTQGAVHDCNSSSKVSSGLFCLKGSPHVHGTHTDTHMHVGKTSICIK